MGILLLRQVTFEVGMFFLVVSTVVLNACTLLIKKNLSRAEIYSTIWLAIAFQQCFDSYIDLKFDLYGYFIKGVDWEYLLVVLGLFPSSALLFLGRYPFGKKLWIHLLYIAGWTAFTLTYERIAILTRLFYLNGWKYWWDIFTTPILLLLLVFHLKFMRKYIQSNPQI